MSFYPEIEHLSFDELVYLFTTFDISDKYASSYLIEIAILIQKHGDQGVAFLMRELEADHIDKRHATRLRATIAGLTFAPDEIPNMATILLSYIGDRRPLVVAEAINGMRHIQEKSVLDKVLTLRHSRSPYIRGAVLRYMSQLFPDMAVSREC